MKAYVLHGINDLRYEDVQEPQCPPGWVTVQVKAAGICSSDLPRILTKGTYHFPLIPGHEFSGVVTGTGSIEERAWIGKRVGVFPLIPCGRCPQCVEGSYEMCDNYDYLGSRRDGGFAEYAAVPAWNLIELPDEISFETGAMLEPLSVALHAVRRGDIGSGDSVIIIGTGMIGIAAALWAKRQGADKVCILGRNEEKKRFVQIFPDILYLSGSIEEHVGKYDVALEAVGTPEAIQTTIRCTAPGGRVILMGNPSGNVLLEQDTYWRILRKQLKMTGSWNSSYGKTEESDWIRVKGALTRGELDVRPLISHCFPQDELKCGLQLMSMHMEPYCKVMTVWNQRN